VLDIALANIERWLKQDHSAPHRLKEWRRLIVAAKHSAQGMEKLLALCAIEASLNLSGLGK
jgi:hypothetical protein